MEKSKILEILLINIRINNYASFELCIQNRKEKTIIVKVDSTRQLKNDS